MGKLFLKHILWNMFVSVIIVLFFTNVFDTDTNTLNFVVVLHYYVVSNC